MRAPAAVAGDMASAIHAAGDKLPGFGHPVHRPLDPRAERILELADARGVSGPHVALARCFRDAVAEVWGKPLTMNVSMPIAAVMLDLGFSSAAVKAVPILARTAGLLAHLAEEQQHPIGFLMAAKRGGGDRVRASRKTSANDARARGRDPPVGRAARQSTMSSYRTQLAYLFERSAFYREKLSGGRNRLRSGGAAGSPRSRSCR